MTRRLNYPLIALTLLLAAPLTTGCGESSGDGPEPDALDQTETETDLPPQCSRANDGVCDEPAFCAVGTDEVDCAAACADRPKDPFLGAACAFRGSAAPPPVPQEVGTDGNVHLTGHIDGVLQVPDGSDPSQLIDRHYRLFVPDTYNPELPTPLVLVLPGNRVALYTQAGYTQIPALAETNRFIVAYLQQQFRPEAMAESWWTDWDWANSASSNPDFTFIRGVVERVARDYNLDRSRVFAAGHSRGAAMSVIAALEMPDLIAGAVSHSGFVELGYDQRIPLLEGRRVPLYFFHGAADDDVCIDCVPGGECGVTPGRSCFSVHASDGLVALLQDQGWTDEELVYKRLDGVAHRWQPQLNQDWWDFLSSRPNPAHPSWPSTDRRAVIWTHSPAFADSPPGNADTGGPVAPALHRDAMIDIPAGRFDMGYPDEPIGRYGDAWFIDQQPEHDVTLSAFSMDRTEVTVADFALFLTWAGGERHFHPAQPIERVESGYLPVTGTEAEPMRQVTWTAARDYCAWAGKRLPTEAEWERAAAGTEDRPYPWPDDTEKSGASCLKAAYFTGSSTCVFSPVVTGSYPDGQTPNGLLDLAGNVGEWTADWYGPYPGGPVTDPTGPASGTWRVVRGGSFHEPGPALRTHARRPVPPDARGDTIGFRCVWDSSIEPDPGILRGELPEVDDQGREPSPRPYASGAPEPEILHTGLDQPTLLAETADGSLWVVESGAGVLTRVLPDGSREVILEDLIAPAFLVTDGERLLVGDQGEDGASSASIWDVASDGTSTSVATGLPSLAGLDFAGDSVLYATDDTLFLDGVAIPILEELDDIQALTANSESAFFIEGSAPAVRRMFAVSLADGSLTVLATSGTLGGLLPVDMTRSDDALHFGLRQNGFPNTSLLCQADPAVRLSAECVDYAPPRLGSVASSPEGDVYFATRRVVGTDIADGSYRVLSQWSRPGDVLVTTDSVLWTDQHAGRILRTDR